MATATGGVGTGSGDPAAGSVSGSGMAPGSLVAAGSCEIGVCGAVVRVLSVAPGPPPGSREASVPLGCGLRPEVLEPLVAVEPSVPFEPSVPVEPRPPRLSRRRWPSRRSCHRRLKRRAGQVSSGQGRSRAHRAGAPSPRAAPMRAGARRGPLPGSASATTSVEDEAVGDEGRAAASVSARAGARAGVRVPRSMAGWAWPAGSARPGGSASGSGSGSASGYGTTYGRCAGGGRDIFTKQNIRSIIGGWRSRMPSFTATRISRSWTERPPPTIWSSGRSSSGSPPWRSPITRVCTAQSVSRPRPARRGCTRWSAWRSSCSMPPPRSAPPHHP